MVQKFVRQASFQAQQSTKEVLSEQTPANDRGCEEEMEPRQWEAVGGPPPEQDVRALDQALQSPSVATVTSYAEGNEPQLTTLSPLAPISEGTGSTTSLPALSREMPQLPVSPRSREAKESAASLKQKYKKLRDNFLRSPAEAVLQEQKQIM